MNRIDTHQHLAFKNRFSYPWMEEFPPLNEDKFYLDDYRKASKDCSIDSTVFMECDVAEKDIKKEAIYLCQLSEIPENCISGVVANGRPEFEGFEEYLDSIYHPRLSGIRRILHTQADELSTTKQFRDNIRILTDYNLPFDLCVLEKQLPVALQLVKACKNTEFVIDHCGIPDIANHNDLNGENWLFWKKNIEALAALPNTNCKISGIALYGSEEQRTSDCLRPYVETVIEAFGWNRVIWGGDWPICTLGISLVQWCSIMDAILQSESHENLSKLYYHNAIRVYHLNTL